MVDLTAYQYIPVQRYIRTKYRIAKLCSCVCICRDNAERFGIEWVFLFGSTARGTAETDSDIDLLVLVKEIPTRASRIALELEDLMEKISGPEAQVTVSRTLDFCDESKDLTGFYQQTKADMKFMWGSVYEYKV